MITARRFRIVLVVVAVLLAFGAGVGLGARSGWSAGQAERELRLVVSGAELPPPRDATVVCWGHVDRDCVGEASMAVGVPIAFRTDTQVNLTQSIYLRDGEATQVIADSHRGTRWEIASKSADPHRSVTDTVTDDREMKVKNLTIVTHDHGIIEAAWHRGFGEYRLRFSSIELPEQSRDFVEEMLGDIKYGS